MTLLRLDGVWFAYGAEPVLRDVSLEVADGEAVALLGRNGAGKTTLTKLVVALLHPTKGRVTVVGRATTGQAPEDLANRVAYVFQHPDQQLFARTVWAEVAFAPMQLGRSPAHVARAVGAALDRVGLTAQRDEHPYDLPPGQRKLVTLAAALAQEPRILVLDEPTQGLDRTGVRLVGTLVAELATEGTAVLAVTHDLGFVAEAFRRAVVLDGGRVAFDGPAAALAGDEERAMALGLEVPAAPRLAAALGLPGRLVRVDEVAAALAGRIYRPAG